ncbi:hypothetical protein [Pontimicrobium sp. IMCC45349]|uniref:hypothetical protein n=1 Tax=Pontimicrobium sp. IMCC45349 TaxID=3391574 RepID=UPI0039A130CB
MEFFRLINKEVQEAVLQEKITPKQVGEFTDSMLFLEGGTYEFNGVTLWGEFLISYNKIKGGVRFTLLDCPNALSWTITSGYSPNPEGLVLHCTINRKEKSEGFIEEVNEFLDEWEEGLKNKL